MIERWVIQNGSINVQGAKEFAAAKRAKLEAGRAASGAGPRAQRRHHGIAFGTGVLDEDDSYGILDDYIMTEEVAGELESVHADERGLPARRGAALDRKGLGDRLAAKGYAFEIQDEEEENDDDDGRVSGSLPYRPGHARLDAPAGQPISALLQSKSHIMQASFVPGFIKAHRPVTLPSFPVPDVPRNWRPCPPSSVRDVVTNFDKQETSKSSVSAAVAPPTDAALRQAIDTTAFYVAKNGRIFENMARGQQERALERGEGNGQAFLLGGPGAEYYAYKVG